MNIPRFNPRILKSFHLDFSKDPSGLTAIMTMVHDDGMTTTIEVEVTGFDMSFSLPGAKDLMEDHLVSYSPVPLYDRKFIISTLDRRPAVVQMDQSDP